MPRTKPNQRGWALGLISLSCLVAITANAYTKVGSGDDGSDLEGATPVTEGKLIESRDAALALVRRLHTEGIRGLGALAPEIERSPLFLATEDRKAKLTSDLSNGHSDITGRVYARTLPEAHAATRFFPVAMTLDQTSLITLHVHEALHRALPAAVREEEAVVSRIALAITAPDASHDMVAAEVDHALPKTDLRDAPPTDGTWSASEGFARRADSDHKFPSAVAYTFREFVGKNTFPGAFPSRLHMIQSDLYPFSLVENPIGLGIGMSLVQIEDRQQPGPLELSLRWRLWSNRDFAFGLWSTASVNMLSAAEVKNSPYGRDLITFGTSIRKTLSFFYVENYLSITSSGSSTEQIGTIEYAHKYGSVLDVKIRAGGRVGVVDAGAFAEVHLADYYKIQGTDGFTRDTGRFRLISGGPEVRLAFDNWTLGAQARFLINSSNGESLTSLGNLLGLGTSQGSVSANAAVRF